jgi:hypothetical protein
MQFNEKNKKLITNKPWWNYNQDLETKAKISKC